MLITVRRPWKNIKTSQFGYLTCSHGVLFYRTGSKSTCNGTVRNFSMCSLEARILNDTPDGPQTVTQDRGTVISLVIPSNAATVQDCIDVWHNQPYVHAMTSRPLLLVLAVARYSDLDKGKNCRRIACHPQATISVPMFSQVLDVSWHRYRHQARGVEPSIWTLPGICRALQCQPSGQCRA